MKPSELEQRSPLADVFFRGCTGKEIFHSEQDAAGIARKASKYGARLKPYRCIVCREWHLTSDRTPRPKHKRRENY